MGYVATGQRKGRKFGPLNPGDTMIPPACASKTEANRRRMEFADTLVALDRTDEAGVYINKIDRVWWGVYVHHYVKDEPRTRSGS